MSSGATVEYLDWLGAEAASSMEFWNRVKEQQEDAAHWRVDGSPESRDRLLHHLEVRTNMMRAFQHGLALGGGRIRGIVLDIGAGIGWTSALLSQIREVELVYATDIGMGRLRRAPAVFEVMRGNATKLRLVKAGFTSLKMPDRSVQCIIMNGSFHHCYQGDALTLLREAHRILTDDGLMLLSNEHYVDGLWCAREFIRRLLKERSLVLTSSELRAPLPTSGEHWRTLGELKTIFEADSMFQYHIEKLPFDACNNKPTMLHQAGWHYYSAILSKLSAFGPPPRDISGRA